jgi:putative FmdB family regulatory protein
MKSGSRSKTATRVLRTLCRFLTRNGHARWCPGHKGDCRASNTAYLAKTVQPLVAWGCWRRFSHLAASMEGPMPLFGFVCQECQTESEILVRGNEKPACPRCGSARLAKQLSAFATLSSSGGRSEMPPPCGASSCCQMEGGGCPFN